MIDNTHENLLANYDWSFPVPIAYGPGRLREMGEHAKNFELTKPLIVTDQGSAGLPFIDTLQQALLSAGIGSEVSSRLHLTRETPTLCWREMPIWREGTTA